MYLLLMGYPPYRGTTVEEILEETVHCPVEYDEEEWSQLSSDVLLLVKNMLAKNPEERVSIDEVLSFGWLRRAPAVRNVGMHIML